LLENNFGDDYSIIDVGFQVGDCYHM